MSGMAELAREGPAGAEPTGGSDAIRMPGVGVLVRNEALKVRHRLGFWTGFFVFLLFVFMISYGPFHATLRGDSDRWVLPDAWPGIVLSPAVLAGLFGATVLILLIASEWSWKTSRQNVIDGLSRWQWFLGKLLLWVALTCVFFGGQVALGGGMAAFNTDLGAGGLVGRTDLLIIAGGFLLVLGYLGMGFLTSFLVRSPGAAIGLFFLWIFVSELVGSVLATFDGWRGAVATYRPQAIINALSDPAQYDVTLRQAQAERMMAMGRDAPEYFGSLHLFSMVGGWLVVFALLAWLAYRARDL